MFKLANMRNDKNWSMDDVDRLLSRTEKAPQKEETVLERLPGVWHYASFSTHALLLKFHKTQAQVLIACR